MQNESFYKFPSTPYLFSPPNGISRQDKVLTDDEVQLFFSETVTVEEKIDGANLGISFNSDGAIRVQNRGDCILPPYMGQWEPLSRWLEIKENSLFDVLLDRYIVFGEWCYYCHSVVYNSLPDWFIAFDIFDKQKSRFLSVQRRDDFIAEMNLALVPELFRGNVAKEALGAFMGKSAYGDDKREGLYFRIDSNDYLARRAKYVRTDFSQSIETHWSKKKAVKNRLEVFSTANKLG